MQKAVFLTGVGVFHKAFSNVCREKTAPWAVFFRLRAGLRPLVITGDYGKSGGLPSSLLCSRQTKPLDRYQAFRTAAKGKVGPPVSNALMMNLCH